MAEERIRPLGESMNRIEEYNLEFAERGDPYGSRMGIVLSKHRDSMNSMTPTEKRVYASKVVDALDQGALTEEPLDS